VGAEPVGDEGIELSAGEALVGRDHLPDPVVVAFQ
jgi:hypothetical protein